VSEYTDAQRMVLSAAFHNGGEMWDLVPPETLDDPWRMVAFAMRALHERRQPVNISTLTSECLTRGYDAGIPRWMMGPVAIDSAHQSYVTARGAAQIQEHILRAKQHLESGVDAWRVVDDLEANLHSIQRPVTENAIAWWTWDEMLAMRDQEHPWVIPNLIGEGERLVITGGEGYGKSTLIYQLILGAAYGVSPIDLHTRFEPQRVMILDVENWHETQVSEQARTMRAAYRRIDSTVEPQVVLLKPRTIDLLQPGERRALLDAVDSFQPNLLFMGSGYKLVDANDDWRVMATTIQRTADEARARSKCAVVIETHAGHGFKGDRNGWRPDGSSYWLRWPEFGIGLAPQQNVTRRIVEMVKWRGDRVTDRLWPAAWIGGGALPWTALAPDEYEARKPEFQVRS
jgi:replicative DNA helicase